MCEDSDRGVLREPVEKNVPERRIMYLKRIFAFLLTMPVLLCVGCSGKQDEYSDRRTDEVIAASADLYHEFDNGTRIVYPDYYAGRYFSADGKKLFIHVTSTYNSELDFLAEKYDCVEFSEYSKNELFSLSEQYEGELAENFPELDFFQTELDEMGNCVIIELDPNILENDNIMDKLKDYFDGRPVVFGKPMIGYAY